MATRASVLIVGSDPEELGTLGAAFEIEGFRVTIASSGAHALRSIAESRPDVVVLDVATPVSDGWRVLTALASVVGAPPVIVTSTKGHPLDVTRAYALGACDYVVNPHDAALVGKARRASQDFAVVA